jgi:hypothetical protein
VGLRTYFEILAMQIYSPFLRPERGRKPFFDGMHEELAAFEFACGSCNLEIAVNVLEFICRADTWFRGLQDSQQTQILRFFDCRNGVWRGHPIIESHDDGQPYFGLHVCNACHSKHLLYVSFYELQPARYVARFQGAARVDA